MAIKAIKAYKNAYGETLTTLRVLTTGSFPTQNDYIYEDISVALSEHIWLDLNATLISSYDNREWQNAKLTSMGFTDVIPFSLSTEGFVKYYITPTKYIGVGVNETLKPNYQGVMLVENDELVFAYGSGAGWYLIPYSDDAEMSNGFCYIAPYSAKESNLTVVGGFDFIDSKTTRQNIVNFWSDAEEADDDPYAAGGNTGEGGGTGTFSGTSDSIEFPNLPTLSAVSTGFITLFNPSIAQMQSLATYMWSDVFDIGLYKTLFADPMDCILGCSIVPVAVPNGGTKTVNVGNVSTGISMTVAASQYVEVDCGTLNVEEYWGSYLDYDPYTKAEIYLPYCGTHALQVDDIMGKAVHVKYHVDILSGACCAYVKCGSSVMYSFVGQCSSSIPISANDWTNVVNGALTIAASVGSLIATGGASAPMAVGAAAAVTGTIYGGGIKQNVEKSGSMGGTGGMLAVQTPYLILTRPRQALPKKQNTYTGYPSFITTKLSDLKGYTEIDSIRITGVPATDAELNELESILKSGVIF